MKLKIALLTFVGLSLAAANNERLTSLAALATGGSNSQRVRGLCRDLNCSAQLEATDADLYDQAIRNTCNSLVARDDNRTIKKSKERRDILHIAQLFKHTSVVSVALTGCAWGKVYNQPKGEKSKLLMAAGFVGTILSIAQLTISGCAYSALKDLPEPSYLTKEERDIFYGFAYFLLKPEKLRKPEEQKVFLALLQDGNQGALPKLATRPVAK